MSPGRKKVLTLVIKAAIVLLTFWFVYLKVSENANLQNFGRLITNLPSAEIWLAGAVVIALMLLNWLLEALKWQRLVRHIERISLWRAVESVFCGLTLAIFTPNRLGEYGGRVFFLSPKRRVIGVVAMAVGNIGQLVLTNVFGALAAFFFVFNYVPLDPVFLYAIGILSTCFAGFFILFYFNIRWLNGLLLAVPFTRRYKKFYRVLARYRKAELSKVLLFCLARYAVFSSQYFLLFSWLIPGLRSSEIVMMISLLFFVQSTLPSLDLFDVGVRSLTASYFFSFITDHDVAVIACTASIWLINIIFPAILGTYFVFKLNFFGSSRRN
ncbi:hypothetical protein C7T94_05095 [Pedobacter yulinensis]|uniref:Lysylphosphatidylglycerol synthetase family protein n=1 Tax=Pedobacter yulinensis TaxID=2126353 RepID=A0A2T3HNT8_9SPHI|nr:lysylphosphatidylglycerol synthase domain-containing protein [Pedobacter yulinensis]PST84110.1 hypothetical protein C7T94_05095 [Pedobacter yulinensis]